MIKGVFALIVLGLLSYHVLFQLGLIGNNYFGKEPIGKYDNNILSQYSSLNDDIYGAWIYKLPEQYHFFGRVDYGSWINGKIPISDDRLVSRGYFSYDEQRYYFYYSFYQVNQDAKIGKRAGSFEYTWSDVYNSDTDEIAFCLLENPEGIVLKDNYLYYAYGKNYYNKMEFMPLFILAPDGDVFSYRNLKSYRYACLNLDTGENKKILKRAYEEIYNRLVRKIS